eukprot:scaffold74219_cov53-Cyclotella_meneghiniana.AAC.1
MVPSMQEEESKQLELGLTQQSTRKQIAPAAAIAGGNGRRLEVDGNEVNSKVGLVVTALTADGISDL